MQPLRSSPACAGALALGPVEDAVDPRVLLVAVAAVLALAALVAAGVRRRRQSVWERFARRRGLSYELRDEGPLVRGRVDGRQLELCLSARGSDGDELGVATSRMGLELRGSIPAGLELSDADGPFGAVQKSLDERSIETGDEAFDRRMVLRGDDPEQVRRWLDADRRRALLRALDGSGGGLVGLAAGRILVEDRQAVAGVEVLDERLALLRRAADELERAGAGGDPSGHG